MHISAQHTCIHSMLLSFSCVSVCVCVCRSHRLEVTSIFRQSIKVDVTAVCVCECVCLAAECVLTTGFIYVSICLVVYRHVFVSHLYWQVVISVYIVDGQYVTVLVTMLSVFGRRCTVA